MEGSICENNQGTLWLVNDHGLVEFYKKSYDMYLLC